MKKIINFLFKDDSGQVMILAAAGMAIALGIAAITVDFGYLAFQRRELQNIVDSAAIAGAWELPYESLAIAKAQEYIDIYIDGEENPYLEDPIIAPNRLEDGVINNSNELEVTLYNSYERWFSRIFGSDPNRVGATATTRIVRSPYLDLLPIADIDLYEDPAYNNDQQRTIENDPFYHFMQGKGFPVMDIDQYYIFMEQRITGGRYPTSGNVTIEYERNIGDNRNPMLEKVTVSMYVDFIKSNPTIPEDLGTGTVYISYSGEYEDDGIEDYPVLPANKQKNHIGSDWITLWSGPSTKGNLGFLDLNEFTTGNTTLGEEFFPGIDKSVFLGSDENQCITSLPVIPPKTGTNANIDTSNAAYFENRMLRDGDQGIILAVLPRAAKEFKGSSVSLGTIDLPNGRDGKDYILLYLRDMSISSGGNKYIRGKMGEELNEERRPYKILNCDLPKITTTDGQKPEVFLIK